MSETFKAFFLNKIDDEINHQIKEIKFTDLMPGNVLVKVEYSSFNFKDGLALTGTLPIIKKYPIISIINKTHSHIFITSLEMNLIKTKKLITKKK